MIEVRIGVIDSPKEIEVELDETTEAFSERLQTALSGGSGTLIWVNDRRGKQIAVASDKLAYVEIDPGASHKAVGFAPR